MYEDCNELLTYRELNIAAIHSGYAPCLLMYYLLRDLDKKGKGYVDYTLFIRNLNSLGFTRNHFYTALKNSAHEKFFTYNSQAGIIEYRSLETVCRSLDCKPGISVLIPLPCIKSLRKFTAYLYATLFVGKKGRSMIFSRERITELTGLCKQTQINYEKLANVVVTPNVASAILPELVMDSPAHIESYIETLPCRDIPHTRSGRRIIWQLPNNYLPKHVHASKGRKHRVNRRIKSCDDGQVPSGYGERAGSSQIFYRETVAGAMFTDQASSYIRTNFAIPVNGARANVYRFNFFAPTKDTSLAIKNLVLTEHKLVVPKLTNPKFEFAEETLL